MNKLTTKKTVYQVGLPQALLTNNKISSGAKILFLHLKHQLIFRQSERVILISNNELGKLIGKTGKTAQRHIKELIDSKVIKVTSRTIQVNGKPCTERLLELPKTTIFA